MNFKKLEKDGLITINKHPDRDLFIANYTAKVQYEQLWTEELIQCRGLIFDEAGHIIARPFRKFFNLSEHTPDEIPNEPFEVFEKMDGSLGILYWIDDIPHISTRGSFTSDQALKATDILHNKYGHLFPEMDKNVTYLFEIIYPENRIVVNYGTQEELILLSTIDIQTGKDVSVNNPGFNTAEKYDDFNDLSDLNNLNADNREGFVIRFESGFRVKVKFEEYVRLHKIMTQVSSKAIWEHLKEDKPMDEMLEMVPDELYNWVKKTKADLISQFERIRLKAEQDWKSILATLPENHSEKDFALAVAHMDNASLLFGLNKGKDIAPKIWAKIRPEFEKPFSI